MKKVAKFKKVSFKQYLTDVSKLGIMNDISVEELEEIYKGIKLPTRATISSAGYDFYIPFKLTMHIGSSIVIPTGIRCRFFDHGYSLNLFPKSGLGFKNRVSLANTVGIVDSDYFYADNEGHIMAKIVYDGFSKTTVTHTRENNDQHIITSLPSLNSELEDFSPIEFDAGDKFIQGVFVPYGIAMNDRVYAKRKGGMGSTGK